MSCVGWYGLLTTPTGRLAVVISSSSSPSGWVKPASALNPSPEILNGAVPLGKKGLKYGSSTKPAGRAPELGSVGFTVNVTPSETTREFGRSCCETVTVTVPADA